MSQAQQILDHLRRNGSITPLDALREIGCMRLSARVMELRQRGFEIDTEHYKTPAGKTVAKYRLKVTA